MALEKDTILARTSRGGGGIAIARGPFPRKKLAPRSRETDEACPVAGLPPGCRELSVLGRKRAGQAKVGDIGSGPYRQCVTRERLVATASYLRYFRDGQQNAVVTVELVIQPSESDGDEAY